MRRWCTDFRTRRRLRSRFLDRLGGGALGGHDRPIHADRIAVQDAGFKMPTLDERATMPQARHRAIVPQSAASLTIVPQARLRRKRGAFDVLNIKATNEIAGRKKSAGGAKEVRARCAALRTIGCRRLPRSVRRRGLPRVPALPCAPPGSTNDGDVSTPEDLTRFERRNATTLCRNALHKLCIA